MIVEYFAGIIPRVAGFDSPPNGKPGPNNAKPPPPGDKKNNKGPGGTGDKNQKVTLVVYLFINEN